MRYADDFIVTGANQELLEQRVKPAIEAFLSARGGLGPSLFPASNSPDGITPAQLFEFLPGESFLLKAEIRLSRQQIRQGAWAQGYIPDVIRVGYDGECPR